jgi:hypothetical protein
VPFHGYDLPKVVRHGSDAVAGTRGF